MNLLNLQVDMAEAIIMNDCTNELITPVSSLAIYQANMQAALVRTLKTTYPLVAKLVGDDFFLLTAKEYIASYPSLSSDLNEYGRYFSDFLQAYEPLTSLAYLPEVAYFEWQCLRISQAPEHPPLDIKRLADISPKDYARLHFILNPDCAIHYYTFPLLRIIALCKEAIAGPIDMNEGGIHLLIQQRHHHLYFSTLSVGEYVFLHSLHENRSLGQSLDKALDADPLFKLDEKLPIWIKNRIIIDCCLINH